MLLNKYFSIFWLILNIITGGISNLILGKLLNVYEKDAWYTKWYYWVLGVIFAFMPALIMLAVLIIQVTIKICQKLEVPGEELYSLPYPWILGIVFPFVGWAFFLILLVYLNLWYFIKLLQGKGEKYI
ncbi:MAG: hypothetical protein HFH45_04355 [Bacilli bacterium]|nr:hypothetical protein [Bacilli bacterium]